ETPHLIPASHRIIQNTINFETLLSQYVRILLVKAYGAEIEARLILKQLLIRLLREEQEKEKQLDDDTSNRLLETIREIANYIQEHPAQPHTIESLAARANLSERY